MHVCFMSIRSLVNALYILPRSIHSSTVYNSTPHVPALPLKQRDLDLDHNLVLHTYVGMIGR